MCKGCFMISALWVALGGALGSVCRYGVSVVLSKFLGVQSWVGTLGVNILGCFLIAFFMVIGRGKYPQLLLFSPLLMVGFCGGFTTFSSFILDIYKLYIEGAIVVALLYLMLSLVLSGAALLFGLYVGQRVLG